MLKWSLWSCWCWRPTPLWFTTKPIRTQNLHLHFHLVWKLENSKLGMMWCGQQEISALLLHWRKIPSPSLLSKPAPVQADQHEVVSLLLLGQEERTIPHLSQHLTPVSATLLVPSVSKQWSLIFKQTTGTAVDTRYLKSIRTLVRLVQAFLRIQHEQELLGLLNQDRLSCLKQSFYNTSSKTVLCYNCFSARF